MRKPKVGSMTEDLYDKMEERGAVDPYQIITVAPKNHVAGEIEAMHLAGWELFDRNARWLAYRRRRQDPEEDEAALVAAQIIYAGMDFVFVK